MGEKIIYHYTDFNALQGIFSRESGNGLRLCNICNMNDSREVTYFLDLMHNEIRNALLQHGDIDLDIKAFDEMFNKKIELNKKSPVYVASFSLRRDDVAQWERYAKGGTGVSIGFDNDVLETILPQGTVLEKVYYKAKLPFHEYINIFLEYYRTGKCYYKGHKYSDIEKVFANMYARATGYKHPSFASESEKRISILPGLEYLLGTPIQYCSTPNGIREYYSLNLHQQCEEKNVKF